MELGFNPLPRPAGSHSSHDCRVAPLGKGASHSRRAAPCTRGLSGFLNARFI
jgi:hypothetical protein